MDLLNTNSIDELLPSQVRLKNEIMSGWNRGLVVTESMDKQSYIKEIKSAITLDSRDRDIYKYQSPNAFNIQLQNKYSNIKQIKIIGVDIQYSIPPINENNNTLKWSYKPDNQDSFTSNSCFQPYRTSYTFPDTTYDHSITIGEGYYNSLQLSKTISNKMNEKIHNDNYNTGKFHNFYVEINPFTHKTSFINRIQSPNVIAEYTAITTSSDVIGNISTNTPQSGTQCLFFIIDQQTNVFSNNLPLIPTNFNSVGGVSKTIINNREYTNSSLDNYYYEFVDDIVLIASGQSYKRYKLCFPNEVTHSELYVNSSVNGILLQNGISSNTFKKNIPISDDEPRIGEGLPFHFTYTSNNISSTLLGKLGWIPTQNVINNICEYSGILTNRNNSVDYRCIDFDISNNFTLRIDSYIFLRLTIPAKNAEITNNIRKSGSNNLVNNIFGKILMGKYGERSDFVDMPKIYYDKSLSELTELNIELLDKDGNIITMRCDFNFTLEITEIKEILKDSLYNSRHGNINYVGERNVNIKI